MDILVRGRNVEVPDHYRQHVADKLQRIERYVALMIGLTAPGALTPVLAILTALGAITVAQRVASVWKAGRKRVPI